VPPTFDLGHAEFVRADIRNPSIARLLDRTGADTVVHAGVHATPVGSGGRGAMKEVNVIGTMQLLAACQKTATVRRFVVKSSTVVYGSSPRDPAVFTEETPARRPPRSGYAKDVIEVEAYVRGFARRRADVGVCILRFANAMGPRVETPMTEYFERATPPTALGYDARLQFIHEDDLVEVMRLATVGDETGAFNAAGDGVLTVAQALRRAARLGVPVPSVASSLVVQGARRAGLPDFTAEQLDLLSYGRVVDCTRLHEVLGYRPKYSTAETFAEFVRERCRPGPLSRSRVVGMADVIRGALLGESADRG
jgi:UDP-glucose 4-epimerase